MSIPLKLKLLGSVDYSMYKKFDVIEMYSKMKKSTGILLEKERTVKNSTVSINGEFFIAMSSPNEFWQILFTHYKNVGLLNRFLDLNSRKSSVKTVDGDTIDVLISNT